MRSKKITIWVVITFLCLTSAPVMGWIQFKDGQTHNIGWSIISDVWVDYQAPGIQTTVNWLNGAIIPSPYKLQVFEDSTINISGGSIGWDLNAWGNSHVNMSGGTIGNNLKAYDNSQVNISGGSIGLGPKPFTCVYAYGSSQVNMSGGSIYSDLFAYGNSRVNMSGGSITSSGGSITSGLHVYDTSQANISSGSISNHLDAFDSSQVSISGGSIGRDLWAQDNSLVNISGGTIGGELIVDSYAILTIKGSDFGVDGQPFGYGELTSILHSSYTDEPHRRLTGILASGNLLNNEFQIGDSAKIVLIPEPASALLMVLGVFALRQRRR